jgi:hypothetical protein
MLCKTTEHIESVRRTIVEEENMRDLLREEEEERGGKSE